MEDAAPRAQLLDIVSSLLETKELKADLDLAALLHYLTSATCPDEAVSLIDIYSEVWKERPKTTEAKNKARPRASKLVSQLNETLKLLRSDLTVVKGDHERGFYLFKVPPPQLPVRPRLEKLVQPSEFARIVDVFCRLEGLSKTEQNAIFKQWVEERKGRAALATLANHLKLANDFDQCLRTLKDGTTEVNVSELRELADKFGIHPLLLDPLRSEPVHQDHLLLDLASQFWEPTDNVHQQGGHYNIPELRLASADAAFVSLILDPGGVSDNHAHPGDELIIVRRGSVEFWFESSEIRTTLHEGDLIHFYAEQKHQVRALKSGANLFIVRFYQIEGLTRQAMWRRIESALSVESESVPIEIHAKGWIRQILPSHKRPPETEVVDVVGLARFLEQHERFLNPAEDLERANERIRIQSLLAKGMRTRNALQGLKMTDVAYAWRVPEFLLGPFSHPAIPGVVVIRPGDFRALSLSPDAGEIVYSVPCRNLSCSDISIAQVVLPPSGLGDPKITPMHSHAGFEAILMEEGTADLYHGDTGTPICQVSAFKNQLCHFNSSLPHKIVSASDSAPARFLVIRFYRDGFRESGYE